MGSESVSVSAKLRTSAKQSRFVGSAGRITATRSSGLRPRVHTTPRGSA